MPISPTGITNNDKFKDYRVYITMDFHVDVGCVNPLDAAASALDIANKVMRSSFSRATVDAITDTHTELLP